VTRVAVFTDHDSSSIHGVTTGLKALLRCNGQGIEARVYTAADVGLETTTRCAKASLGVTLPWSDEMRVHWPRPWAFASEVRRQRVDVVHVTTPGPVGLAGRWIASRLGLPLVGSYHTEFGESATRQSGSARLGAFVDRYVKWFYGPCATLFAPSAAARDGLTTRGYGADRIRLWGEGVDANLFSPRRASAALRAEWHVDGRRPAILYAGRLARDKGLGLIKAVRRALLQHGLEHQFVFAGEGAMRAELESVCPDGHFLGGLGHDQVAVAMASAHVFLFPSATETLGHAVLEAQASGLPVVVSDRGGPHESMLPGVTGFVAEADHPEAFARALVTLLTKPADRAAMGCRARQYAETRDWPSALAPLFDGWHAAVRHTVSVPDKPTVGSPVAQALNQELP
jgi:glycosyltransferase involved in cell wall biosynthesis